MRLKVFFFSLFISTITFAQPWLNITETRQQLPTTLYEYQAVFNTYWNDKAVKNGYYTKDGEKQKAYGWKQFKRWEYFWETRVNPQTGAFPTDAQYKTAFAQYKEDLKHAHALTRGAWVNLGPSTSGGGYAGVGRINTIAFHPSDNNTFWIGSPSGGLWKTTDGGNSWNVYTDKNEVMGVSAIAISSNYASDKTIYIGTGDRDASDNYSTGVLKSTDGGATWSTSLAFNLANGFTVNRLLIDPTDNNIIYAATSNGIYKTTNAGSDWTQIYSRKYIQDLEFKPNDHTVLYASNKYWGEIYKLTNSGDNISIVYDDDASGRIELAVSANKPDWVYAVIVNDDNGLKGIYKSTDGGDSYSLVTDSPNLLSGSVDGSGTTGQGWYDLALTADPDDGNTLYCGGINTWESTDGGQNWDLVNHWYGGGGVQSVHADKHFLVFNNGIVYECNDGGLYKTDNGTDWDNISNGIINSQMYRLGVSQTESNATITGLQDNGTKLLHTDGTWYDVKGGDGMECLIDYTDYNIQYGTYTNGQISRTTDLWTNTTAIEPTSDGAWVTPYIIHPSSPATLYAGYEDVWKTIDRGDSWTQISSFVSDDKIRSMAISASNPQVLYVADLDQLWKTTNDGTSWTELSGLPSSSYITSIAIKNDNEDTVWVTFGGYNTDGVYQSTDGGSNWTNISSGLPSIPVNTIVQDTMASDLTLYAGTDFGVYFKVNNGDWQLFNSGLPKVVVDELEIYYNIDHSKCRLRAATYGRGLWESSLNITTEAPVANFSVSTQNTCLGNAIKFTDNSLNTPTSWSWNFGDGNTSTQQNPSHTYANAGTYTVSLKVTNSKGNDTETKSNYITIRPNPTASFTVDNSNEPTIHFTNTSTNGSSYLWKFGDGNEATTKDADHTYVTNKTYVVRLYTTNDCGTVSKNKNITITKVGIETLTKAGIKLYPNPSSGIINISGLSPQHAKIKVVDITGKVLMEKIVKRQAVMLNLSEFSEGVYQIIIQQNGSILKQRIVLKK